MAPWQAQISRFGLPAGPPVLCRPRPGVSGAVRRSQRRASGVGAGYRVTGLPQTRARAAGPGRTSGPPAPPAPCSRGGGRQRQRPGRRARTPRVTGRTGGASCPEDSRHPSETRPHPPHSSRRHPPPWASADAARHLPKPCPLKTWWVRCCWRGPSERRKGGGERKRREGRGRRAERAARAARRTRRALIRMRGLRVGQYTKSGPLAGPD